MVILSPILMSMVLRKNIRMDEKSPALRGEYSNFECVNAPIRLKEDTLVMNITYLSDLILIDICAVDSNPRAGMVTLMTRGIVMFTTVCGP